MSGYGREIGVLDGQVIDPGRRQAAQDRARRIQSHLAGAATEYAQAILERDWEVLGYPGLEQWRADLFGAQRLTVDARRQVHELLTAGGMSTRQAADATGTSQRTVVRDVSHNDSPRSDQGERHEPPGERHEPPKSDARRSKDYRDRKREQAAPPQRESKQEMPSCAHDYRMVCAGCGKRVPPGDVLAVVEQREAELARVRDRLEAAQREITRLSAALEAAARAAPAAAPQDPGEGQDSAHGSGQVASNTGPCAKCRKGGGSPARFDGDGGPRMVLG